MSSNAPSERSGGLRSLVENTPRTLSGNHDGTESPISPNTLSGRSAPMLNSASTTPNLIPAARTSASVELLVNSTATYVIGGRSFAGRTSFPYLPILMTHTYFPGEVVLYSICIYGSSFIAYGPFLFSP